MAYVITQNCCKDASCVPVCPVDCIRPVGAPGELTGEEMLYIDPETCIDCGACLEECPVEAIYYAADLTTELLPFEDINAKYFEQNPLEPRGLAATVDHAGIAPGALRVAVVGAGPAACYAAAALVRTDGVEVDVYDRLPTPFGLVRAGVAPDHQHTKAIVDVFGRVLSNPRVQCHFNVEIGRELSHAELLDHHHAVIYAHGASQSRDLGIPGEQLDGNHAAAEFVGWYNGHPDHASRQFDLSGERAVVIGNGNVALDVARVLLLGTAELSDTDIAEHALEALAHSAIREVVILGRRGPRDAAFSVGEFMALEHLAGIDVIIESTDLQPRPGDHIETVLKLEVARRFAGRPTNPDRKRIVFRFCTTPTELVGSTAVEGLRVLAAGAGTEAGTAECLDTRLVLRSIGYRGSPTEGLPFDDARGVVPNDGGRVLNTPGVYVTGWIKRGPRGVIGTNRVCAEETVARLWQDYDSGSLTRDIRDRDDVDELVKHRGGEPIGWKGWKAIDAAERRNGTPRRRPRVKFVAISAMLDATKA